MKTITFETQGDFKKIDTFLRRILQKDPIAIMHKYGALGVERLQESTPKRTGLTAASWSYSIEKTSTGYSLKWKNSNIADNNVPVVILLQYGHGTKGGTWVEGLDFINPALRPIFVDLSNALREEM